MDPSKVRPSARQVAWQQQELTAFIHFGVNTFTDLEWGTGIDDPAVFDPSDLDCAQWVRCLVDAGFKSVILTAKHHDGFCLWPSQFLKHTVDASPYDGDVVRELSTACAQAGLGFGFYLSPADLYQEKAPGGYYGNGSPAIASQIGDFTYEVDDYNRFYLNQLYELLTQYGPIAEVWLDGANPTSTDQAYAYDAWFDLIRRLAPDATIAIGGPDVRWVGNEDGFARETEWSVVPFANGRMVAPETAPSVAGPAELAAADELRWYPAEVDVSIRPGWFYHATEDAAVKSLPDLLDIYRRSVGRNAVLLLNIPPDRRGHFAAPDVEALAAFGAAVRDHYSTDLVLPATINVLDLREDITNGQQVESFTVEAQTAGTWSTIAEGTTIGHRRLLPLTHPLTVDAVRVHIHSTRADAPVTLTTHYDPTLVPLPGVEPGTQPSDSQA
ncbi:alpha-L-fucosidase [Kribbella sandramycini]|uniref:alpha-L-fucosidase n=1 Tax=Kribbella sandramycini TaxID=60450 RepID=A0A7Y4P0P8_9ACTN|nr:alpha-L-fucosidase [Kribbella sandramycini]MBB6565089.1 alpha-L-fucosidase [Kribbella sandramycini]NOL41360.1 alpha-L-fucosidase [Kribbella sandramycini]